MTRFAFVSSLAAVSFVASAVPARAELVYFNTGRTMSVKGHRVDGDSRSHPPALRATAIIRGLSLVNGSRS